MTTRFGLPLAKALSAFATSTASPGVPSGVSPTNASAVGPVSVSPRSRSSSAVARRTRVFLYTLYSPPASRSAARRSCRSRTVRPRYSVNTTASVEDSFSRTSSTTATFSGLGFSIDTSLPLFGRNGRPRAWTSFLDRAAEPGVSVVHLPRRALRPLRAARPRPERGTPWGLRRAKFLGSVVVPWRPERHRSARVAGTQGPAHGPASGHVETAGRRPGRPGPSWSTGSPCGCSGPWRPTA